MPVRSSDDFSQISESNDNALIVSLDFARVVADDADAIGIVDRNDRLLYYNSSAERLLSGAGVPAADNGLIGVSVWDIFPEAIDGPVHRAMRRAIEDRAVVFVEHASFLIPGRIYEMRCAPYYGGADDSVRAEPDGLVVDLRDISEQRRAETERGEAAEHLALALGVSGLGTWEWDIVADRETWSDEQARLFGVALGTDTLSVETFLSLLHPEDVDPVRENLARAVEAGSGELEGEFRIYRRDTGELRWFLGRARAYPNPANGRAARIVGVNGDITERKRAEERREFLADLFERTRGLLDQGQLVWETVQSVGQFLGLSRFLYADIDSAADSVTVHRDWCAEGIPSVTGVSTLTKWGNDLFADLTGGRTVVVNDFADDPRTSPGFTDVYTSLDVRAQVIVPLHRDGKWVAVFSAHMCGPNSRAWSSDDVILLETVARQMWLAIEKARLYEFAQLEEERFRALVQAGSQMVWRSGPDGLTDEMRDWRAFTGQTISQERGLGWMDAIHPDDRDRATAAWTSAIERHALFECEYRIRAADGAYRWFFARGVPLFAPDGTLREYIGALLDINARKKVESTQARALAYQQRIAETLQRSLLLTPSAAALPPGVELATQFEPAWDEADIGGDFYDAFAIDDSSDGTPGSALALVVGDVTGKGLEAAAYTAEVKFALRAMLRVSSDPAAALERLNNFLIDSRRLDRRVFGALVSLCVVIMRPDTGETYAAAAGAEPPLVVRAATGELWETPAAGMMLGVQSKVLYDIARFRLEPGDILAMTTDGITEARDPDTRTFFGYAGLRQAVQDALPLIGLSAIALSVVDSAKKYAKQRLHDDVCLLLVRRTAPNLPSNSADGDN